MTRILSFWAECVSTKRKIQSFKTRFKFKVKIHALNTQIHAFIFWILRCAHYDKTLVILSLCKRRKIHTANRTLTQKSHKTKKKKFHAYSHFAPTHPQIFLKFSKFLSKISPYNRKFPQIFSKISQKHKIRPPACIFSVLRHFFALFWAWAWKNLQIFSAKDIFCAIILIVFEFAWQTNGKFGTEFAIRLLRQAKSESARRKSQLKSALTRATKARFACHFVLSYWALAKYLQN